MSNMKQIANIAGVSRGTVDRVLNKRGGVNPETQSKVLEVAAALNYTPNRLGKTLAVKKKNLKFGYILFGSTSSNPFFEDIISGIKRKASELKEYGISVDIRQSSLGRPERQVELIDELVASGVTGIVLTPINHPMVASKINEIKKLGVLVVTANSDISNCERIAYVGSDCIKGGKTAAGLMALITGGRANIGTIIGSNFVVGHAERVRGFQEHLAQNFPDMHVVETVCNNDDDLESFEVTKDMLEQHPEIDALFLAAAGVKGACRAVRKMGLSGKLHIVSFDTVPHTRKMLKEGVISATLGQQPEKQAQLPLDILLNALGMDTPPAQEHYYTKIEIWIKENL